MARLRGAAFEDRMNTVIEVFKNYNGPGYYCVLFIIALLYLWFTEEDKRIRALLIYTPSVIQVLFFIPYFYMLYNMLDEGTYYRILWLMPMSVVIAYAGCKVIGVHTKIGLVLLSAILIMGGTYVYKSVYMSPAENAYHLPEEAVQICDMIKPEEGRERVWAVFPTDLVHFVRQYTTTIQMPFGRNNMVAEWENYENAMYDFYIQPVLDVERLSELASEYYCNYIILDKERILENGKLEDYDIIKIGETDHYIVYRNKKVPFWDEN